MSKTPGERLAVRARESLRRRVDSGFLTKDELLLELRRGGYESFEAFAQALATTRGGSLLEPGQTSSQIGAVLGLSAPLVDQLMANQECYRYVRQHMTRQMLGPQEMQSLLGTLIGRIRAEEDVRKMVAGLRYLDEQAGVTDTHETGDRSLTVRFVQDRVESPIEDVEDETALDVDYQLVGGLDDEIDLEDEDGEPVRDPAGVAEAGPHERPQRRGEGELPAQAAAGAGRAGAPEGAAGAEVRAPGSEGGLGAGGYTESPHGAHKRTSAVPAADREPGGDGSWVPRRTLTLDMGGHAAAAREVEPSEEEVQQRRAAGLDPDA